MAKPKITKDWVTTIKDFRASVTSDPSQKVPTIRLSHDTSMIMFIYAQPHDVAEGLRAIADWLENLEDL